MAGRVAVRAAPLPRLRRIQPARALPADARLRAGADAAGGRSRTDRAVLRGGAAAGGGAWPDAAAAAHPAAPAPARHAGPQALLLALDRGVCQLPGAGDAV